MESEDISSLELSLSQYQTQLQQIQVAINAATSEDELSGLAALSTDILELIKLTQENLSAVKNKQQPTVTADPLEDEYLLFKAALGEDVSTSTEPKLEENGKSAPDIVSELQALEGMKCQAPYRAQYDEAEPSYHNAMVSSVDSGSAQGATDTSHIQVRVVFINPTQQAMRLCPFYLEGKCRFEESRCRFSHGELVALSDLREYSAPDFSLVREGCRVLALGAGSLWHRGTVVESSSSEGEGQVCHVKFEASGETVVLDLEAILPLSESEADDSELSSESDTEAGPSSHSHHEEVLLNHILLNPAQPGVALGAWESHTRGVGSRLMARMGYVTGAGLGSRGQGRVEPVEALVVPQGMSLDHIMRLKEATGDKNLFTAEKRQRRQRARLQKQQQRSYEREKQRTKGTVFDFINSYLGPATSGASSSRLASPPPLRKDPSSVKKSTPTPSPTPSSSSNRGLNVRGLQLQESIRRTEREVGSLTQSLARHGSSESVVTKTIRAKLEERKGELERLRGEERSVDREKSTRQDRHKMATF